MGGETSERRIPAERPHTAAPGWHDWLETLRVPPLAVAGLFATGARLVVVAPHPDDEILGCGGLLALHTTAGRGAAVVAVTDGEASHADDPAWPAERLAPARRRESLQGLALLGVPLGAVIRLGLPDGELGRHRDALREALRTVLMPDDVVVTTWRLDGHPDHEATGAVTAEVAAERGCALLEVPIWMWHWSAPHDPRVAWSRLRSLALAPPQQHAKALALAEHRTQLQPRGRAGPVLDPPILARAADPMEYFFV